LNDEFENRRKAVFLLGANIDFVGCYTHKFLSKTKYILYFTLQLVSNYSNFYQSSLYGAKESNQIKATYDLRG